MFTNIEIIATKVPADSDCRLTSANSLKDDGTSHDEVSYWLIATSAMTNPENKLMQYTAKIIQLDTINPGPLASSGNTIMDAPTVLLVINNAAPITLNNALFGRMSSD
mmetsp:Transcript_4936/g.6374  ORF Transcript_4936/g.6374 Transcript_4936/m.6374 type:complete len:108 (-) Transcript_4936:582-905(-)